MKTIARNRKKLIAEIATRFTDCQAYDAVCGDLFSTPAARAWSALAKYPHARLIESSDGAKYTVHVHSNHWYHLTEPAKTTGPATAPEEQPAPTAAAPQDTPAEPTEQGDAARRAEFRTEYIVGCIREAGSMYPEDAKAYLAEHDAHRRDQVLAEVKYEVVAWLAKKATEKPMWDAAVLASKVDRGAVRAFLGTAHYRDALDAHRAAVLTEAGWVPCSPKWLATHPDECPTAPRVADGDNVSHWHPDRTHTEAYRRIEEALDYLATKDATQLSEDAGVMGFHIVAVLDGPARTAAEAAEDRAARRKAQDDADDARTAAIREVIETFDFGGYGLDDIDPNSEYAEWVGDLTTAIAGALPTPGSEAPRG